MAYNTGTLNTKYFNDFIEAKNGLITQYDGLCDRFDNILQTLFENWKGSASEAFANDAKIVRANITGVQNILQTMCNTLTDCRNLYEECDKSLGNANRNAV